MDMVSEEDGEDYVIRSFILCTLLYIRASSMHGDMEKVKDHLEGEGLDGRIYNDKVNHRKEV
jgi:hypothetical protein